MIGKVSDERKKKNKLVTSEDLQEFNIKIEEEKEKIRKRKEIKYKDELEKLEKAKNFKPSYIGNYYETSDDENKTLSELRQNEIEIMREYEKENKEKLLNKIKQPKIDENLKK